ncbi:unnamed protein product [Penicillium camemberti]|uniref:Str. FM013 n=1 Tax=Penicillium camemberti (strain FM 013) TaxID=1429867 RepID=A0A0G4PS56_PENC3|nr:unnamed protein product [Penicillium camemberti]
MIGEQLQYTNKVTEQTIYENTPSNLAFMEFRDLQGVLSNVTETCAVKISLELIGRLAVRTTSL